MSTFYLVFLIAQEKIVNRQNSTPDLKQVLKIISGIAFILLRFKPLANNTQAPLHKALCKSKVPLDV